MPQPEAEQPVEFPLCQQGLMSYLSLARRQVKLKMRARSTSRVAAIILAAGKSTRMGEAKQPLPLGGSTALGKTVENIRDGGLDEIVLVLGAFADNRSTSVVVAANRDLTHSRIIMRSRTSPHKLCNEKRDSPAKNTARLLRLLLMAAPMMAFSQTPSPHAPAPNDSTIKAPVSTNVQIPQGNVNRSSAPSEDSAGNAARNELDHCQVHEVKSLPGSHHFASDFIVTLAGDPDPGAKDANVVWGLTADLSDDLPLQERAMYISKSSNGGQTWTQVARVDSRYFDAGIGEGLRNGLSVFPGGTDFVITTQRGAFQVFPQSSTSDAVVKAIAGPRVPSPLPWLSLPKMEGDPIKGDVVLITADGRHMIVGYGYFDLNPQIFTYHRGGGSSWIEDGPLPHLPTQMDIFSMQFDSGKNLRPSSLYVGTGDQAYRLNLLAKRWTRVIGVGPDSAIHGMSIVAGPHLAACWGVYNPISPDAVKRVTEASFLLHRSQDEVGPNIRAYGIEVDRLKPNRQIVTSITGVYTSDDSGKSWRRMNDLPEGEFRTAHFNYDGTVIVSGIPGTFLANPFSNACSPRLRTRDR